MCYHFYDVKVFIRNYPKVLVQENIKNSNNNKINQEANSKKIKNKKKTKQIN